MINLEEKKSVIYAFEQGVKEMYPIVSAKYDIQKSMDDSDVDTIKDAVKSVQNVMIGNIPEGLSIPEVVMHVFAFGEDKVLYFTIKVINKSNSSKKFSFGITVTREKAFDVVFDFLYSVYHDLLVDELVTKNLEKVNDVLQQAVASAGVDYSVRIVSDLGNGNKKIVSLRDDEVVFVADSDRVFNLDDVIVLFDEPTEYVSEDVIQNHFNSMVDELRLAQTTAQLVSIQGGALVAFVCGISKRVKPMTIIKSIYSKNVSRMSGKKEGTAYYLKDGIYAVVNFTDDVPEVILSPFDINTFVNTDKDILADIV